MTQKLENIQELIERYKREHETVDKATLDELLDKYNLEQIRQVNIFLNKSNIALNCQVKKLEQEYEDDPSEGETLTEEEPSTEEMENSDDEDFIDDSEIKDYQSQYIS